MAVVVVVVVETPAAKKERMRNDPFQELSGLLVRSHPDKRKKRVPDLTKNNVDSKKGSR